MTDSVQPWDRLATPAEIRAFIQGILEDDPLVLVEDHIDHDGEDDFEDLANRELNVIEYLVETPSEKTDALLMDCWSRSVERQAIWDWDDPRHDLLLGATWEFVRAYFDGDFEAEIARVVQ